MFDHILKRDLTVGVRQLASRPRVRRGETQLTSMVISAAFLDSAQKTECSTGTHLPIFGSSGILILKRKSLNPELHVAANFDLCIFGYS